MPIRTSAKSSTITWCIVALYIAAATAASQQYGATTSLSPSDIEEKLQVARPSFFALFQNACSGAPYTLA